MNKQTKSVTGKPRIQFDYTNQAWIENGRYVDCGHAIHLHCGCYGRKHEGEKAMLGALIH